MASKLLFSCLRSAEKSKVLHPSSTVTGLEGPSYKPSIPVLIILRVWCLHVCSALTSLTSSCNLFSTGLIWSVFRCFRPSKHPIIFTFFITER